MSLKVELYLIFENPTKHKYGRVVQSGIFLNIFISIVIMFLMTEKSLAKYFDILEDINFVNVVIFTIEYILRVYSISHFRKKTIVTYMLKPMMIIDLIAILPFYLSYFYLDFGFVRALRVLRVFKLFRIAKFVEFDTILVSIIKEKKEEFIFITLAFFIIVLTIVPLVFYFENSAQPEVFSSMLETLWWAIITFTTVGYGDMYPITAMGKILTTILCFFGIAFYAIPGSIFTSTLLQKINEGKNRAK